MILYSRILCTFKPSLRSNTYQPTYLVPRVSETALESFIYHVISSKTILVYGVSSLVAAR